MKLSMGAAVRLHRIAVRDRPDSVSAFKWNACPPSPESARLWIAVDTVEKVQRLTSMSLILELISAAPAVERMASSRRWATPRTKCTVMERLRKPSFR